MRYKDSMPLPPRNHVKQGPDCISPRHIYFPWADSIVLSRSQFYTRSMTDGKWRDRENPARQTLGRTKDSLDPETYKVCWEV